jgi:hypothetical protein
MNQLLENMLGVINDGNDWIEVLLENNPPKRCLSGIGKRYVYITKYRRDGSVENRSIGLPEEKAIELGRILLSITFDKEQA